MKKQIIFAVIIMSSGLAVAQTAEQPSLLPPETINTVKVDELIEITDSINNEIVKLGSKTQETIDVLQSQIVDLDIKTQDNMNKMFESLMNEIDSLQLSTEEDTTSFYSELLTTMTELDQKIIELEKSLLVLEQSQDIAKMNILFEFDSVNPIDTWQDYVNTISAFMNQNTDWHLSIIGHADEKGSSNYNYELGLKRAETVRDYLVAQNVSVERISVQSFGETVPAMLANTKEAHQLNRRVNFVLVKK